MGRQNCGNRPPGDSDNQVSDVFAIGIQLGKKKEMQSRASTKILSVTGQGYSM